MMKKKNRVFDLPVQSETQDLYSLLWVIKQLPLGYGTLAKKLLEHHHMTSPTPS